MERKQAAFAGSWYPSGARDCESAIQRFLTDGQGSPRGDFLAVVVPHAGWVYSGSIACRGIAALRPENTSDAQVDTVILFGAHMHRQSEPFILTHGALETPLGDIEVDQELSERLSDGISLRKRSPSRFPDENTIELQLPFIRYFFPMSRIVVVGVAPTFFAPIVGSMAVQEAVGLGRTIRVIGSTDMTHYGPDFGFTDAGTGLKAVEWVRQTNDKAAVDAMAAMDEEKIIAEGLSNHNMCCPGAVAATVAAARKLGADRAVAFDYATSYEKSAGASFVGYAGVLYARS